MRRVRRLDPCRGLERLAVDDGGIVAAHLLLDGGEGVLHLAPGRLLAEVGERLVTEAGFHDGRRRGVVEQESGVHQQLLLGNVFGEARPQERRVGRVFEQPTNQIRHAGQKLTERRVDAHPLAEPDEGVLHRIGHAVEHLDLVAGRRQAEHLGGGHRVGQAAQVMAAERRTEHAMILQQELGQAFVGGVGLRLAREDGDGPALLGGDHGLVVPVGSLDEPHPNRRAATASPVGEGVQVVFRRAEIRLDRDADIGPVAELVFVEQFAEDAERQVLVRVLLHVEVDEHGMLPGEPEDRSQPLLHDRHGAVGVDRIELAVKRRQLHRDVDPGQIAIGVAVDEVHFGPGVDRAGEPFDEAQVFPLVPLRLVLGDAGLAEEVDGEGELALAEPPDRCESLVEVRAGDELASEPGRVAMGVPGEEFRPETLARQPAEQPPQQRRQPGLAEVFAEMPADVGRVAEQGQGVDEAEELDLHRLVGHRPVHEAIVEPGRRQGERTARIDAGEELFAVGPRQAIEFTRFERHAASLRGNYILEPATCPNASPLCHAHGFAWACVGPSRSSISAKAWAPEPARSAFVREGPTHAHAKPWAWHTNHTNEPRLTEDGATP